MKTTFAMIAAVAAFTAGAFGAPAVSVTAERLVAVADEEKTVTLEVTGLKWASGCSKKVQAALESVKGVSSAKVGPKSGTNATATVKAKKDVKVDDLIAALKAKGYGAKEKASS